MKLTTPLHIMIVVHDEKCEQYSDMGMHLPIVEHQTAPCIIYDVSAIESSREGDTYFTTIVSGQAIYQVLKPFKEVAELINKSR